MDSLKSHTPGRIQPGFVYDKVGKTLTKSPATAAAAVAQAGARKTVKAAVASAIGRVASSAKATLSSAKSAVRSSLLSTFRFQARSDIAAIRKTMDGV